MLEKAKRELEKAKKNLENYEGTNEEEYGYLQGTIYGIEQAIKVLEEK